MSMLVPGDKPDLRSYPVATASDKNVDTSPPSVLPGLTIFRWALLFVTGYILYGAMILTGMFFLAAVALPESGGVLAVFRHSPLWYIMASWLPYFLGAVMLNRRRHLAAWFLLAGSAIQLIPALRYNSSIIWTVLVVGVPAVVAMWLLRQPDVRVVNTAPIRIFSDLDFWSRRALAVISAGYAAFAIYQFTMLTPQTQFPIWLLVLPGVAAIATVIPMGPYLLAIRLIPDDRRNAVVLLAIGIAINLLLTLAGSRESLFVTPFTVLVPAVIAFLQTKQRQREGQ